jgi:putative PIN family toxin of toxin-antitoxin system
VSELLRKVVFDCNIFAQALLNPLGPAGACVNAATDGRVVLFISQFVLDEIREIPNKATPRKVGLTHEKAEALIALLVDSSQLIAVPQALFVHPIDPDDSHYVNLAIAADARLIVSRDRHLLNLNNSAKPWAEPFRRQYSHLQILSAEVFLEKLGKAESA